MPAGCSDVAMPRAGSLTGDHAWQIWERVVSLGMEPRAGGQASPLFVLSWVTFCPGEVAGVGDGAVLVHLLSFHKCLCTGTRVHTGQD